MSEFMRFGGHYVFSEGSASDGRKASHASRNQITAGTIRDTITAYTRRTVDAYPTVGGEVGSVGSMEFPTRICYVAAPPALCDGFGNTLTWGAVWDAHDSLERAFRMVQTGDGQWRARTEDEVRDEFEWLHECRDAVASWPGPICGVCWGASCWQCGYVFEDAHAVRMRVTRPLGWGGWSMGAFCVRAAICLLYTSPSPRD